MPLLGYNKMLEYNYIDYKKIKMSGDVMIKKRTIRYILVSFVFFIFFIIFSCDYGISDGKDLTGKWSPSTAQYTEYFRFYDDATGHYEIKNDSWGNRDFTWSISQGQFYKIVKTDMGDYEYYFSYDKSRLYLRLVGNYFFKEWVKRWN